MNIKIKDVRSEQQREYGPAPDLLHVDGVVICPEKNVALLFFEGWIDICHCEINHHNDGEDEAIIFWPFWPDGNVEESAADLLDPQKNPYLVKLVEEVNSILKDVKDETI